MVEGDIVAGRHFPTRKPKHTLSESLERYVQEIMPWKTLETQHAHRVAVAFWRERRGYKLRSDIAKGILSRLVKRLVRFRLHALTLQHPPHHKEEKQCMLDNRKSRVSIRDYAPYGGEWEGEQVIICPLLMRQEIHHAMGEHADKKG